MRQATPIQADEINGRFDEIIDVRSPSEFAEDHLPGAINLPVLNDEERARIGTIYKQVDTFLARRDGAAIIAERSASYLRGHFANKDPSYFPLVYCWRGGMRSNSLAVILAAVGWRTGVVTGGYREYRRETVRWFAEDPLLDKIKLVVLAALTGSAKTDVLRKMKADGAQVLDLEGLAVHRGSLLGNEPDQEQPSQKLFESRLRSALLEFDLEKTVYVESESHRIGKVQIPVRLFRRIKAAPVVELLVPRPERARYLLETYAHFCADRDSLKARLAMLEKVRGQKQIDDWGAMIDAGDWQGFVEHMLEFHYDPAYRRSRKTLFQDATSRLESDDLSPAGIARLATAFVSLAESLE